MSNSFFQKIFTPRTIKVERSSEGLNLANARINKEYIIKDIRTNDEEIRKFLFTLGCYEGEMVTVLSELAENYVISVKDARYSIDKDLAEAIITN